MQIREKQPLDGVATFTIILSQAFFQELSSSHSQDLSNLTLPLLPLNEVVK